MCRYIETIRIENGEVINLSYHQRRMDRTFRDLWNVAPSVLIKDNLPKCQINGTYKMRVVYGRDGIEEVTCSEYEMKKITTLKLVDGGSVDYRYKGEDRTDLNRLMLGKENCDNIIIVKNGLLTDTSYTNIALFDGDRWVTPRKPLLAGTMRAKLLDNGDISEGDIRVDDLSKYKYVTMFNAMIDMNKIILDIKNIY